MATGLIDKTVALALIQTFHLCYKQGVYDAYDIDNKGAYEELFSATREPGVYGTLTDERLFDWKEFSLRLTLIARRKSFRSAAVTYLQRLAFNAKTYFGCVFPIAQDFYLRGAKDYYAHPNPALIPVFMEATQMLWMKNLKKVTRNDMLEDIQLICYERMASNEQFSEHKFRRSGRQFQNFMRTMVFALRYGLKDDIY